MAKKGTKTELGEPNETRCFVAMAFGWEDSDAVFDKFISPAVAKCCGTTARRVDRVEHNDDIDNQIIAELQAADLVIADLTYARPSVYFEAGYAQRQVPVIYTVRRDHFRDNQATDPHGNLRVHFDLKMKNIIDWRDPNDADFAHRLERRIRFVLKPLLARKHAAATTAATIASFERLALSSRLSRVQTTALDALEKLGYFEQAKAKEPDVRFGRLVRVRKTTLDTARVKVVNSALKADLKSLARDYAHPWYNLNAAEARPKWINELIVICALGKVNLHSVAAILREYDVDETHQAFFRRSIYSLPGPSVFQRGSTVTYQNRWGSGSGSFSISRRGGKTEELKFNDGYFGSYGHDSRGRHRFIRRTREAVVPVMRTFMFVDRLREIDTLPARITSVLEWLEGESEEKFVVREPRT